jgi:PPP family 3-phenylpropionic acid transporter
VAVGTLRTSSRIALFFTAIFLVAGTKLPYLPVWFDWRGLTAAEIAVVAAAPLFLRIAATPAIAFLADRWGNRRGALVLLAWASLGFLGLLSLAHGFWAILVVTLVMALINTSIMPLTETIAMEGVRHEGADYGRMRLWGSLSFIFASFAAGVVVVRLGPASVIGLLIAGAAATVAAAHLLPGPRSSTAVAAPPSRRLALADVARLVAGRRFALFLAAVGAIQAAHAVFYTFGVLHWQAQGHSAMIGGLLWAVGVIAEIGLFAYSGAVVARVGSAGLIVLGGAASVLRWLVMGFDPPLALLVPLQALHGLTYGATHLGAVHFMSRIVPPAQAGTAQALYASVTHGIAMGLATLLAGRLYPEAGGLSYLAMAATAALGMAAALAICRDGERQERISPP